MKYEDAPTYELWCKSCGYPSKHKTKEIRCPVCRDGWAVYIGEVPRLVERP